MTKKDFEFIAAKVAELFDTTADPTQAVDIAVADHATDLADYFATRNPNFDRSRFLQACGMGK